MFGPIPQKMEGLCYVMPITGHEAYTGKEEDIGVPLHYPCNQSVIVGTSLQCLKSVFPTFSPPKTPYIIIVSPWTQLLNIPSVIEPFLLINNEFVLSLFTLK
jgi:hypothetical protein